MYDLTKPIPERIAELTKELEKHSRRELIDALDVAYCLLETRDQLLKEIPPCPEHGWSCIPYAMEWVKKHKPVTGAVGPTGVGGSDVLLPTDPTEGMRRPTTNEAPASQSEVDHGQILINQHAIMRALIGVAENDLGAINGLVNASQSTANLLKEDK